MNTKTTVISQEQLQQQLTQLSADAQGITAQFLQLQTRQVQLTADIAVREADLRGLDSRKEEAQERSQQLGGDLAAGEEKTFTQVLTVQEDTSYNKAENEYEQIYFTKKGFSLCVLPVKKVCWSRV